MQAITVNEAANVLWRHAKRVGHVDGEIRCAAVAPVLAVHDAQNATAQKYILVNIVRQGSA